MSFQTSQIPASGTAPSFADMGVESAAVSFGYYQENVAEGLAAVEHNKTERPGPIGWWSRHKLLTSGLSFGLALTLAYLPLVQSGILLVLGHAR